MNYSNKSWAIAALRRHRSGGASPLSRFASQPKALLTIAGAFHDLPGLLVVGLLVGLAVLL